MQSTLSMATTEFKVNLRSFTDYMKEVENAPLWKNAGALRHSSPEGGNDTVGFGHKMTDAEVTSGKIYGIDVATMTRDDANTILAVDLLKHKNRIKRQHPKEWEMLSIREKQMLIDFDFNLRGGVKSFPKFKQAVFNNDIPTQRKEYVRKYKNAEGKMVPIGERNRIFYKEFLSFEATGVPEAAN